MRRRLIVVDNDIKGEVSISIKKKDNEIKIRKSNNISIEFASTIATALVLGANNPNGGAYAVPFSLPQGLMVLLLSNGVVVAQILVTLQGLTDTLTNTQEITTVKLIGSDATPAEYTFDSAELYTVVNNTLSMKVAHVTLPNPLTKGATDVVQVMWQITAVGNIPFVQFGAVALSDCQSSCNNPSACSGNVQNTFDSIGIGYVLNTTPASVFNFLFALLLVPNLNNVLQNQNLPMSQLANKFFTSGEGILPLGIVSVAVDDPCFNVVAKWQYGNPVGSSGVTYDNNYVYAILNIIVTPNGQPMYLIPAVGFGQLVNYQPAVLFTYPLAVLYIQGVAVPNQSQQFGILLKVPYGASTLQSVNET